MYVVVIVDEDNNEDDEGGHRSLGENGDTVCDHCSGCRGGRKWVNANRGAGGKAAGRALFCGLIGADGEHQHQTRATRPPNALVMLSALATSSPSLLMVQMLM